MFSTHDVENNEAQFLSGTYLLRLAKFKAIKYEGMCQNYATLGLFFTVRTKVIKSLHSFMCK